MPLPFADAELSDPSGGWWFFPYRQANQVIAHTNLYWTYQTAPGRTAGTVETKGADFGATS